MHIYVVINLLLFLWIKLIIKISILLSVTTYDLDQTS